MKKSIIAVVFILVLIATLPIIGNNFLKNSIDDKVAHIQSFGVEVRSDRTFSSYLFTKRHFEFYLKDSSKFMNYLNTFSNKQKPPYLDALLDGFIVGIDIEYSNLPFAKSSSLEIYPLNISSKMEVSLKENNPDFYNYISKFLQSKGILYHINYNLMNEKFDGYLKDIDESYAYANSMKLNLFCEKFTFKGKGELLAPSELNTKVKKIKLQAFESKQKVEIYLENLKSVSSLDSQEIFSNSIDIKTMKLLILGTENDISMSVKKLKFIASSSEENDKVELSSKSSINSIHLASKINRLEMKKLNTNIILSNIDKKIYSKLLKAENSKDIYLDTIELLSKGINLKVVDASAKEINTKKLGELEGFSFNFEIKLKENAQLSKILQENPSAIASDIEMKMNFILSKKMFHTFIKANSIFSKLRTYAQEKKENYIFNIKFIDSKTTINGQVVK